MAEVRGHMVQEVSCVGVTHVKAHVASRLPERAISATATRHTEALAARKGSQGLRNKHGKEAGQTLRGCRRPGKQVSAF